MTRTEQALETLTQDSAKRAVKILQKVPLKDLCKVEGLSLLYQNYRLSCVREYLEENYEFDNEKSIVDAASDVLDLIVEYDYTETDAVLEVVKKKKIKST